MEYVFGESGQEVESGLLRWEKGPRETIYMVNTSEIELRDETLLFRLLGQGRHRKEAVVKIFQENLERYVTLLNHFDLGFREMARSEQTQGMEPEEFENLRELHDTRMEVLLELGRKQGIEKGREEGIEKGIEKGIERGIERGIEKGIEKGREEVAVQMLREGLEVEQIARLTGLSEEVVARLQEQAQGDIGL